MCLLLPITKHALLGSVLFMLLADSCGMQKRTPLIRQTLSCSGCELLSCSIYGHRHEFHRHLRSPDGRRSLAAFCIHCVAVRNTDNSFCDALTFAVVCVILYRLSIDTLQRSFYEELASFLIHEMNIA